MKKRVFVDTNILLDVLLEREGFYHDALKIWASAEEGTIDAYIAAISVNNVHYVIKRMKSETTAMIAVRIILRIFKVIPVMCAQGEMLTTLHAQSHALRFLAHGNRPAVSVYVMVRGTRDEQSLIYYPHRKKGAHA